MQIVGAPELPEELDGSEEEEMNMIVKLAKEKMDITLKPASIEKVHRLGKRNSDKPRDIVLRFKNNIARNKFYTNRKKTIIHSDPKHNIYINDHLTEYRRNLFYTTRHLVKKNKVFAAWTQQGNILIRKNEGDQPLHIRSHEHLAELQFIDATEISDTHEEVDSEFDEDDY